VKRQETDLAKDPASENERTSQRPRRKPVTIDLPAAEVGRPPDAASPEAAGAPAAEAASAEPPVGGGGRSRSFTGFLLTVLVGAAVAAGIVIALARTGYLIPANEDKTADATSSDIAGLKSEIAALKAPRNDLAPLAEQVAALQKSVADFSQQSPAAPADAAALKDLQDRLATLESAPRPAAAPATNLEPRIAALSQEVAALKSTAPPDTASLQSELTALHQQLDALSASIDKLPKEDRIAAIETKLGETSDRLDATMQRLDATVQGIDNAAALAPAVAAEALQSALDSGRPFQSELTALKSLGVDAAVVDALAPEAQTGLPTVADLRARFEQAIASVPIETPIPENTGAIDRLLQSAEGLVSVRPAHPTTGSDPSAILSRIRGALAAGDLKSALDQWNTLPDAIKTPTADWAELAKARVAADDLVAGVRSAALAKLAPGK
jgi:hypothetical protein